MAGDYFAAAMDEAAIASAGIAPLAPLLDRIAAAASVAEVRDLARDLHHTGVEVLHSLGVSSDFEDADRYLVYVGQGGLGLPERDYYTRDDERSVALREAYVAHVAKQLQNLGDAEADAREAASAILAFETLLAQASLPAEKMRDVKLTMNRHAVEELDVLMPGFGLAAYARDLGVTSVSVNIDNPGFFTALDTTLRDGELAALRNYLRWHLVRAFASSLTPPFEEEAFAFYGRTLGGQQKMRPRWKRMLDSASADIGDVLWYIQAP
jgi:predicted metalloendopeptidase